MNINSIVISGRVVRDPEHRVTQSGTDMTTFALAVNRMKKDGQDKADADFINVVAFGKTAEVVGQYLVKGQAAVVQGRLQIDRRENNGQTSYYTNVVANQVEFGAKPQGSDDRGSEVRARPSSSRSSGSRPAVGPRQQVNERVDSFEDDDIPF